jgi:hypothetical protein
MFPVEAYYSGDGSGSQGLFFFWQSTIAAMEAALKAGLVGKESWDKVRDDGGGTVVGGRGGEWGRGGGGEGGG